MIKVLFESSIFLHQNVGGISKYITELNKNLLKNNISSRIFSPIAINYYLEEKKKNKNINFLKINQIPKFCRKIFFFINNIFTFVYIIIHKPNILHFSYYNKSLLKYLSIPYVITIYDLIYEKMNFSQNEFEKKELLEKAKHIICISKQTKKDLIKFYKLDKNKISVVYLGTNNRKFKSIKKRNKYILYVGSRKRYKNFENFILAFSKSKYLIKNYKIVCFGGGNFQKDEIKNFKNLGLEQNLSYIKGNDLKLSYLYRRASLYVSLSIYEGFGLTLLEAMQSRCPVLCSNIPVFREIYKNSCEFVNPNKISDITKGLKSVLKSPKKQRKLITNSKKIIEKYTWENCAKETAKIYRSVSNYEK